MRITEIMAEWHYIKESSDNHPIPFSEQDSNIRDLYFRIAKAELPLLLGGYFGSNSKLHKLIRGCIQDFINVHGGILTQQNYDSLARRLTANIKGIILHDINVSQEV